MKIRAGEKDDRSKADTQIAHAAGNVRKYTSHAVVNVRYKFVERKRMQIHKIH